jgi:two-component system cell cycle sensor histidine kinase/response regulator CckA
VLGDPTHMHQVLLNLCINARDAITSEGTLRVSAENRELAGSDDLLEPGCRPGRYLVLTVSDTGSGIPQAVLDRIFDPFFTTKPEGKGTGLGLSTVIGIVRNHGGFVRVRSEVGQGSEFIVYLPAVETTRPVEPEEGGQRPRGRGETVLLVDDEDGVLQATAELLRTEGYHVLTSVDGIEALAVYSENQSSLAVVVTDVMMPRVLRKLDHRLRIIATSGLESDSRFEELHQLGIQAFIPKPFTAKQLLSTLRRVLDEADPSIVT